MKLTYILTTLLVIIALGIIWSITKDGTLAPQTRPVEEIASDEEEHTDADETHNEEMEEIPGSDIGMEYPISDITADRDVKVFNVSGFDYGYDISEIRVNKGDTVTINFTSASGTHDWVIDEFDARTAIISAGSMSSVTFTADTTGEFEFYCSVGQHRANGMVGTLIVE